MRLEALGGRGRRRAPRLRSLYRLSFWPAGAPFEARCEAQRLRLSRRPRHDGPAATCTCGIYGAPFELIRRKLALDDGLPAGASSCSVRSRSGATCSSVSAAGARRWRYPSRLFVPLGVPGAAERAVGLRDYGVPVELLETSTIADALDDVAELAA